MKTRPILHPSDFSPASRAAFVKAIEMAKATGAPLLAVHVLDVAVPMVGDDVSVSRPTYVELLKGARAYADKQLARLVADAKRARVRARPERLEGRAADRIVRLARSRRAAVIIMGTHGRSGLAKLLLGSMAARVVATATCPVLTVRATRRAA